MESTCSLPPTGPRRWRELASGQLIDLFPESQAIDNGYVFLAAERRWDEPLIAAFRDWVLAAFSEDAEGR